MRARLAERAVGLGAIALAQRGIQPEDICLSEIRIGRGGLREILQCRARIGRFQGRHIGAQRLRISRTERTRLAQLSRQCAGHGKDAVAERAAGREATHHLPRDGIFLGNGGAQRPRTTEKSPYRDLIGAGHQRFGSLGGDSGRGGRPLAERGIERMQSPPLDYVALRGTFQLAGENFGEAAAHPVERGIAGKVFETQEASRIVRGEIAALAVRQSGRSTSRTTKQAGAGRLPQVLTQAGPTEHAAPARATP